MSKRAALFFPYTGRNSPYEAAANIEALADAIVEELAYCDLSSAVKNVIRNDLSRLLDNIDDMISK